MQNEELLDDLDGEAWGEDEEREGGEDDTEDD